MNKISIYTDYPNISKFDVVRIGDKKRYNLVIKIINTNNAHQSTLISISRFKLIRWFQIKYYKIKYNDNRR